jgi:multidrug efflux pump
MRLSRIFIDRPILAWVVTIMVMLAGAGAILMLPIARYPDIAPPQVTVHANFPGASAETLESSVTAIIEQQLTGIDGLLYFASSSDSAGNAGITLTFAKGTNPDVAQVEVQNKVQQAVSRLPGQVQQQGIAVTKSNPDFLMFVTLYDTTDRTTNGDLLDYAASSFEDDVARIPGVGNVDLYGAGYAMQIWLDPVKLASVGLMPSDIRNAVAAQNVDISAGQLGQRPAVAGQMLNAVVKAKSRFHSPEQFRNVVVKTLSDGAVVRLSDVARVEMGQEDYAVTTRFDGHPAAAMAVSLAPGGDALKTSDAIKARIKDLSAHLPAGYAFAYPRDSSDFIRLSIREVIETLLIAIVLVVVVMFVFLQSWRATLIPTVAVPVVLLGSFGCLALFGYSINTMTLFGMVLSIGLLVDDAIVVVESVERIMAEEGLSPREATIKAMEQIGSALVGVALVLSAVMLPMAFFGGSTGVIYRQFSVTIVSAMVLSVLVALALTPALCATILKPHAHQAEDANRFGWLDRWFDRLTTRYLNVARGATRKPALALGIYAIVMLAMAVLFVRLPTSFLPREDQGQLLLPFKLPAGATFPRTDAILRTIEKQFFEYERRDVLHVFSVSGTGFYGYGQNTGIAFVTLRPFEDRKNDDTSARAIIRRSTAAFAGIRDAHVVVTSPGSIAGLGQANGFSFQLLNATGMPRPAFVASRDRLIAAAQADPKLAQVRSADLPDQSQLRVNIDEPKLSVLGLAEDDVTGTLSAAWGSTYINDFVDRGRVKRVYMQGGAPYRMLPGDLDSWFVRSAAGTMVPFSSFATTDWEKGPDTVARFNGRSSYEIDGEAAPGVSSGEAMQEMIALRDKIAPQTRSAWSGLSFQESQASGQAPMLYGISLLVIFLCLAALYESWVVPLSVILVIPLGILGAVLAVTLRGLENTIYFQVGLLTTTGLVAKNAILIVEFAETARRQGRDLVEASLDAAKVRFRPILMTSVAFIAGVLPLTTASGAGAQSRIAIGTAVTGGMLSATILAIFYVPMFFVLVGRVFRQSPGSPSHNLAEPA